MLYDIQKTIAELDKANITYKQDVALASYTSWKIGGPADLFVEATSEKELIALVNLSHETNTPLTIIGAGSNILISDSGIRGLVVHNKFKALSVNSGAAQELQSDNSDIVEPRLTQIDTQEYYSFEDIHFDESHFPTAQITVGSGYYMPLLMNVLIDQGITGLQWFAGIPGTIGGAIYNNIHGGDHFISEYVENVTVITPDNQIKNLAKSELNFEYDLSRFHNSGETILSVTLNLYCGDPQKARNAAMAWAQKKKLQSYKSAGCCFKNLTDAEAKKLNLPTGSWGYIIDKILGLKGMTIGDAQISLKHAAFIDNLGQATASDVLALFDLIYSKAKAQIGIQPHTEIFLLGFTKSIIERYA